MKQSASLALAAAFLALSCKDTTSPKFGPPIKMVLSGETGGLGVAGEESPVKPRVLVTDAEDRPVPDVSVTFTVSNGGGTVEGATQVTNAFGIATVGRWILGRNFGVNRVVASSASLPPVTFQLRGIAPDTGIVAFDIADPAGDTAPRPDGKPPAVDLLRVRGDFKRDSLIITLTFASPVRAGNADTANSIGGGIELDMDDNPLTGYGPPDSNRFGASAVLGVDYVFDLFNSFATGVLLFSQVGFTRAPISYPGNSVVIRVPLRLLGDDDGNFSLAINLGPFVWASDVFPNAGQLVVRRERGGGSIVVSSASP
jgi:hypothetical protein